MQAAALSSLHSDLESRQQIRGSAGGLGFNAAEAKAAKKAEKKSKRVRGADDNRREFSSTSAGAVAAGHWDPWARPVAFEMKAKNTIVGGLYTMFVKGPTMGGTIPGSQIAMPAPAPSDDTDDRISKKVKKAEKRKEKKKDKKASNTDSDSKGAGAASPARGDIKPVTFNWEEEVVQRLKQAPSRKMGVKALRKATLKAARAALGPAASNNAALKKLYKKTIKTTAGVCEVDDPETGLEVVMLQR